MHLTHAQLEKISLNADRAYARDAAEFFKREFPHAVGGLALAVIEQRALSALHAARTIGVTGLAGTFAYVGLGILAGPAFLADKQILGMLRSPDSSPNVQVAILLKKVVRNFQYLCARQRSRNKD